MSRLVWDGVGERDYETGVDRGVLYVEGRPAVSWNGLTSVEENSSGAEPKELYLDGLKYYSARSGEDFAAVVRAFYSPIEFDECDGSLSLGRGIYATQQRRKPFGLSYRTKIGNDVDGETYGYKIHLVYNAVASPANRQYVSMSSTPNVNPISWSIITKPVFVPNGKPTAHLVLDSTIIDRHLLYILEDILYGSSESEPRLPLPEEIVEIFNSFALDGGPPQISAPVSYDGGFPTTIHSSGIDGGVL